MAHACARMRIAPKADDAKIGDMVFPHAASAASHGEGAWWRRRRHGKAAGGGLPHGIGKPPGAGHGQPPSRPLRRPAASGRYTHRSAAVDARGIARHEAERHAPDIDHERVVPTHRSRRPVMLEFLVEVRAGRPGRSRAWLSASTDSRNVLEDRLRGVPTMEMTHATTYRAHRARHC